MKNVFLAAVIMFCASTARAASIESTFLMTETQDGQPMKDLFEIWTVKADLVPANPKVQIQVSSFVTHVGETSVFPWLHESTSVSQVKPGIYKADLLTFK